MNPARSTGPALIVGGWVLGQLWLFWVAPPLGAVVAAAYRMITGEECVEPIVEEGQDVTRACAGEPQRAG